MASRSQNEDDPNILLNDLMPGVGPVPQDQDEEWYLIRGNHVDAITRQVTEVRENRRAYWWAIIYVPAPWDLTVMQISVSKNLHDVTVAELLDGKDYVLLDYESMTNYSLDDLKFLDANLGIMDDSPQFSADRRG